MKKYVIFAHNKPQMIWFARNNRLKLSEIFYVSDFESILGVRNVTIIFLNGWHLRPGNIEIFENGFLEYKSLNLKLLVMDDRDLLSDMPTKTGVAAESLLSLEDVRSNFQKLDERTLRWLHTNQWTHNPKDPE